MPNTTREELAFRRPRATKCLILVSSQSFTEHPARLVVVICLIHDIHLRSNSSTLRVVCIEFRFIRCCLFQSRVLRFMPKGPSGNVQFILPWDPKDSHRLFHHCNRDAVTFEISFTTDTTLTGFLSIIREQDRSSYSLLVHINRLSSNSDIPNDKPRSFTRDPNSRFGL